MNFPLGYATSPPPRSIAPSAHLKRIAKFCIVGIALSVAVIKPATAANVMLYGVMDTFLGYYKNHETSVVNLNSGGLAGSRWGMRGEEDLSGDLKARFVLEGGINVTTGTAAQSGRLFGRRATVGLISKSLGKIEIGRQPTPGYDWGTIFDPILVAPASVIASLTGEIDNPWMFNPLTDPARLDNLIRYNSPLLAGLSISLSHSIAGNTSPTNQVKTYDVGSLIYQYQGLQLGYGFGRSSGTTDLTPDTKRQIEHAFGAIYRFPWFSVYLTYQLRMPKDSSADKAWQVGMRIPFGIRHAVHLGWGGRNGGLPDAAPANTLTQDVRVWAAAYIYEMSKRTSLYAYFKRLENRGSSRLTILPPAGLPNPAHNGEDVTTFGIGINHRF